jgi:hypothetical protein
VSHSEQLLAGKTKENTGVIEWKNKALLETEIGMPTQLRTF